MVQALSPRDRCYIVSGTCMLTYKNSKTILQELLRGKLVYLQLDYLLTVELLCLQSLKGQY